MKKIIEEEVPDEVGHITDIDDEWTTNNDDVDWKNIDDEDT